MNYEKEITDLIRPLIEEKKSVSGKVLNEKINVIIQTTEKSFPRGVSPNLTVVDAVQEYLTNNNYVHKKTGLYAKSPGGVWVYRDEQ